MTEVRLIRRPRIAQIVAYLAKHAAQIEGLPSVSLQFDCVDGVVKARLTSFERLNGAGVDGQQESA